MYLPIIIIIQLFTIFVDGSCDPQTCNGLKIKPPFWIPIPQQSDCGPPGFDIACDDNKPRIKIHGDSFIVRDIFYKNSSFLLTRYQTAHDMMSCPIPRRNFSVDGTPFSYGPFTTDLYFLYNCTAPYDKQTYPVDCGSNATRHSFAVFHVELLRHWNYSISSCAALVTSPVLEGPIDQLLKMNYSVVLDNGFVLQWKGNHRSGHRLNLGLKIGIGVGAAALSCITMCIIFSIYHHRYKRRYTTAASSSSAISHEHCRLEKDLEKAGVHIFEYHGLEEATGNFDPKTVLGDGGYGAVYKGKLEDGRIVAVKKLYQHHLRRVQQFLNEIEILTCLRHRNLVSLYGCTSCHSAELLLVYEYVSNGTLADHLHGLRQDSGPLSWATRLSIAIETSAALAYLHASAVIHRDIKSSNILLDNNFVVKVADFGLSRFLPTDVTHVSTGPQGTPGYVDPEYNEYYQLTDKSDVYSFGVVLIELISSKPAVDIARQRSEINLATMAVTKIRNHALHDLVDSNLGFESDYRVRREMSCVAELAFQCLQNGREMRPRMQEVLDVLEEIQSTDYSVDGLDIPADSTHKQ
ncbi:hypothetical protein ACS0TY_031239 [Phlomoides rotata]